MIQTLGVKKIRVKRIFSLDVIFCAGLSSCQAIKPQGELSCNT